jgi:mitochondrial fission protein ELM1
VGLSAPPPGLLFTAGGTAAAVGASCRRRGSVVVQVQDPRIDPARFDLVVVNQHDRLRGPNVIVTRTALHRVTQERLQAARVAWRRRLAPLPRPLVSVLVGGSNGRLRLGPAEAEALAQRLAVLAKRDGAGLAITPSRRTAPEVREILQQALAPLGAWIWDMEGDNPYFGLLALADAIVVTSDSISMLSEAVATHAPVLLFDLPGRSGRIARFRQAMLESERVRLFTGRLESWPVLPLDDTAAAAAEMKRRLGI